MAIIRCKMCGGEIELSENKTIGICEYCGTMVTFPKIGDEQRTAAFNRGNDFRRQGEFDKALAVYERIVAEDDTDAEAHWCCALCRFGIEYVEDPASYEYIPTCHRASFDSFLEDVDYLAAVSHSHGVTQRQYQKDAAKIAEVQRAILATSRNEKPFDVFICYKESDENGSRTVDSTLAQDIYYQLTEQGRRVFFARITLEDKGGAEYEPYIFAALHSAKVMIVVGTKPENFNAVWVKNEWSRYLSLMRHDRKKLLLPCYRDMDPYDLPEQLSVLQSYDMAKIGFVQDLIRGVNKVLDAEKKPEQPTVVVTQTAGGPNAEALLKRGSMALEDGEWDKASDFFEQVLNMNAECAEAYLGKQLAADRWMNLKELVRTLSFNGAACREESRDVSDEIRRPEAERALCRSYAVEHFLSEEELEESISFRESVTQRGSAVEQRRGEAMSRLEGMRSFARARQFASGSFKETLEDAVDEIRSSYDRVLEEERRTYRAQMDGARQRYETYLQSLEQEFAGKKREAEAKRAELTAAAVKAAQTAGTEKEYRAAITLLRDERLAGSDTERLIAQCEERIRVLREQKRLAAETARVQARMEQQRRKEQLREHNRERAKKMRRLGKYALAVLAVALFAFGCVQLVKLLQNEDTGLRAEDLAVTQTFCAAGGHIYALSEDGTVLIDGPTGKIEETVQQWKNIASIAASDHFVIGLRSDGTVAFAAEKSYADYLGSEIESWQNIVAISASPQHVIGLRADGTAVAAGYNGSGECKVETWNNLVAVDAADKHSMGVSRDGSVHITGGSSYGAASVGEWSQIVAASMANLHTVGLRADGTVVAIGSKSNGKCDVKEWTDIVSVSAGSTFTAGLRSDGTVVCTDENMDVSALRDIVQIKGAENQLLCLQKDGTLLISGKAVLSGVKLPEKILALAETEELVMTTEAQKAEEAFLEGEYAQVVELAKQGMAPVLATLAQGFDAVVNGNGDAVAAAAQLVTYDASALSEEMKARCYRQALDLIGEKSSSEQENFSHALLVFLGDYEDAEAQLSHFVERPIRMGSHEYDYDDDGVLLVHMLNGQKEIRVAEPVAFSYGGNCRFFTSDENGQVIARGAYLADSDDLQIRRRFEYDARGLACRAKFGDTVFDSVSYKILCGIENDGSWKAEYIRDGWAKSRFCAQWTVENDKVNAINELNALQETTQEFPVEYGYVLAGTGAESTWTWQQVISLYIATVVAFS